MNAITLYRASRWAYLHKLPFLPKLLHDLNYLIFHCHIPPEAQIGKGTVFGYGGMGCVVHQTCIIGENCIIGYGTTLGSKRKDSGGPIIGNSVYIATGSKLLGRIRVGDGAVIGANSVCTHDVPERCAAAGIPARIIEEDIDVRDISTHIGVNEDLVRRIEEAKAAKPKEAND